MADYLLDSTLPESAAAARRRQVRNAVRDLRDSRRILLGPEKFKDLESTCQWIYRHPEINRRCFLNQAGQVLLAALLLEELPNNLRDREESLIKTLMEGREAFAVHNDPLGAVDIAAALEGLISAHRLQKTRIAQRVLIGCAELRRDAATASAEDIILNMNVIFERQQERCGLVVRACQEAGDLLRLASGLVVQGCLHYLNLGMVEAARTKDANELFDAARQVLKLLPKQSRKRAIVLHQALAWKQRLVALSFPERRKVIWEVARLRDLDGQIGSERARLETLKVEMDHLCRLGDFDQAERSLEEIKARIKDLPVHPPWTHLDYWRREIELLLSEGKQEEADALLEKFIQTWRAHPNEAALYVWQNHRPGSHRPQAARPISVGPAVPAFYLEPEMRDYWDM